MQFAVWLAKLPVPGGQVQEGADINVQGIIRLVEKIRKKAGKKRMSGDDLTLAWSRYVQTNPRLAIEVLGKATLAATDQQTRVCCSSAKLDLFFFSSELFGWLGQQRQVIRHLVRQVQKCPVAAAHLLSKITEMLHLAARETLRHLSAMSLCRMLPQDSSDSCVDLKALGSRNSFTTASHTPLCPEWGPRKCPGSCWGAMGSWWPHAGHQGCSATCTQAPSPACPWNLLSWLWGPRTSPASWQARRAVSRAGRGTIRKISLAQSLACSANVQGAAGGGVARCCLDCPWGLGDSRVPNFVLDVATSSSWSHGSDVQALAVQLLRIPGGFCTRAVNRDTTLGLWERCSSAACRTPAIRKRWKRSCLPALGNIRETRD